MNIFDECKELEETNIPFEVRFSKEGENILARAVHPASGKPIERGALFKITKNGRIKLHSGINTKLGMELTPRGCLTTGYF